MHDIGIIILAAGKSQRMGSPKQLLRIGENSLIRHILKIIEPTNYSPKVVVLGNEFEKIKKEVNEFEVVPVLNPDFEKGMGTSIAKGIIEIQKLAPSLKAVFILLVDQPYLKANLLVEIEKVFLEKGKKVVASKYGKTFGVPALFDNSTFENLQSIAEEKGAKKLIYKYLVEGQVDCVEFPEGKIDLDTPEDYEKFLKDFNKK